MNPEDVDYVLGEDVTERARPKGTHRATAVLSVRLDRAQLGEIEMLARHRGEDVSRVLREAVAQYLAGHRTVLATEYARGNFWLPGCSNPTWTSTRGAPS